MITHIRVKNFKSWQDSGNVGLAPLTGFFGTNSSGKSSLLQMLLLLKQTVGSKEVLFFGDGNSLVNLGNFREVIHGHKLKRALEFEFGCELTEPRHTTRFLEGSVLAWERTIFDVAIGGFTFNTSISENGNSVVEKLVLRLLPPGVLKIVCKMG